MNDFSLYNQDVLEGISRVADKSIDLVLTSPPYNIGKEYEKDCRKPLDEYVEWLGEVISAISPKIKDNGSFVWQVGNHVKNGEIFPIDILTYNFFHETGYRLRNRIVWQFNFGLHAQKRLSGRYETLLWFTKSDDYTFNLDDIRVPQLYPGKRKSKDKGGAISGNPKGKNPSDYWVFSAETHFKEAEVWQLPNVKSNHVEKTIHPCQYPYELAERAVLAFSNKGDTILDPFLGSGTTAIASLFHKRKFVGFDIDRRYVEVAKERISKMNNGELRVRQSGKKIAAPDQTQNVARRPQEWL